MLKLDKTIEVLKKVKDFLKGKKTFLIASAAGLVVALKLSGVVDEETANTVLTLLGFGGLATLKAGQKK